MLKPWFCSPMQSFTILLAKTYVLQVAPEQHPDTAVFTTEEQGHLQKDMHTCTLGNNTWCPGLVWSSLSDRKGVSCDRGKGITGLLRCAPQPPCQGKPCPDQDNLCPQGSLTPTGWAGVIADRSGPAPLPSSNLRDRLGQRCLNTGRDTERGETVPVVFCLIRNPVFRSSPDPALLTLFLWPSRSTHSYTGQLGGSRMPHSGVLPGTQALLL